MDKEYKLKDKLNFGKYNGETIEYVLELNPSYLVWANETIDWFKLDPKVLKKAKSKAVEEEFNYHMTGYFRQSNFSAFDDDYYDVLDASDYF